MSLTITLPKEFPYVIASLTTIPYVLIYQIFLVGKNRKASGIKYPQLYAEKSEAAASPAALKFNCAQRAHQNTLENLPAIILTLACCSLRWYCYSNEVHRTLITGIKYPVVAASFCGVWALTRIIYTRGYVTGDPANRSKNGAGLGTVSMLGLLLSSTWTAVELVRAVL
jgi:glutathione S-transferase